MIHCEGLPDGFLQKPSVLAFLMDHKKTSVKYEPPGSFSLARTRVTRKRRPRAMIRRRAMRALKRSRARRKWRTKRKASRR